MEGAWEEKQQFNHTNVPSTFLIQKHLGGKKGATDEPEDLNICPNTSSKYMLMLILIINKQGIKLVHNFRVIMSLFSST